MGTGLAHPAGPVSFREIFCGCAVVWEVLSTLAKRYELGVGHPGY